MNNLLRGLISAYGAKKLGGGCFGTVIVFILIWVALGQCSCQSSDSAEDLGYLKIETAPVVHNMTSYHEINSELRKKVHRESPKDVHPDLENGPSIPRVDLRVPSELNLRQR